VSEARAAAYRRKGEFILHPLHRTRSGLLRLASPIQVMPDGATDDELGRAVLAALSKYSERAPNIRPEEFSKLSDALLEATKVKSLRAFASSAVSCSIEREDEEITLIPSDHGHLHGESRSSFIHQPDRAIRVHQRAGQATIGRSLREAFDRCR